MQRKQGQCCPDSEFSVRDVLTQYNPEHSDHLWLDEVPEGSFVAVHCLPVSRENQEEEEDARVTRSTMVFRLLGAQILAMPTAGA